MHFAKNIVPAALFAACAILTLQTPKAHAYSPAKIKPNTIKAEYSILSDACSISDLPLTRLATYVPKAKIATYSLSTARLNDMRNIKLLKEAKNKASYASEKVLESSTEAEVELKPAEPVIVQAEIKTETEEAVEFNLNAEVLLGLINDQRVKIGLQPLIKDDSLMQLASSRVPQLFDEIFVNGNMHAGFHALNLPYYATENIIYNRTETGAFNWWMNSGVHRAAIQNPNHTHTGIACGGKTCAQIFTSFQAK